ncbi:methyltransferase domain-containing protein [Deinococcus sp.]|uniref:methyltransferase domain-containing protein n=1 Tax=Deinococcus sp. TaxID=47478 RepID=UPI0025D429A9|nr:methyltransferase domain-containing protein [Deinococcus sp.]
MTERVTALRNALIDGLVSRQVIRSPAVEAAMRAVPRHHFAPWLSLEDAYFDDSFLLPEATAQAPATISQPTAVAAMLEAFDLHPGLRVLEIGAGSGYNAALMAELVGPTGSVVTVDLEASIVEAARPRLAHYANVQVIHGDGADGWAPGAPYDRIVATVGAWDVPPAWAEQLAPEGKLVFPLHLGGESEEHVLISLRKDGPILVGAGLLALGMVLMRGASSAAGHAGAAPAQDGERWSGAPADELIVTVYPHGTPHDLAPDEKLIDKPSARIVLRHRYATSRFTLGK